MAKKGKKGTPEHLDKYFARNIISEDQYKFFWPQYWKAKKRGLRAEEKVIEKFFGKLEQEKSTPVIPAIHFEIRKSMASAKRDIAKMQVPEGFHVIRRDRFGRFNSRGRSYQAVRTSTKRKNK